MKSRPIILSLVGISLLLVALYNGEPMFYMLFTAVVLVFLCSLISLALAVQFFSYRQRLSSEIAFKGDQVELEVEIHNDHAIPFSQIELEYETPASSSGGGIIRRSFALAPHSNIKFTENIDCQFRGSWPVGLKRVHFSDIFGLMRIPVNFTHITSFKKISLMVYPRILMINHLPLPQYQQEGAALSRARSTQDINQYSDIRKYAPGDPMKKIHWKLTARQRELMVKNYERDTLPDTMLYLDSSAHNLEGLEAVKLEDTLVECATAVAYYILSHWLPLKIITYTDKRMVLGGNRPDNFSEIHKFLAKLQFKSNFSMPDILETELHGIGQNGCIFMIVHDLDPKTFAQLIRLCEASLQITLMLITSNTASKNPEYTLMTSQLLDSGVTVIELGSGESLKQKLEVVQ